MPKNKHTSTHTILLKLNGDRETTVRQHDSWQGQRTHHGKTQQPPPMNQHILTTAGHHTGHKDCTLTYCWRLPFCASKHVGSGRGCVGRWTWEQLSLHTYTHRNKLSHTHTQARAQSRSSDYAPRWHVSFLWPVKNTHTHILSLMSVHVSMPTGVCARERRGIWKCHLCYRWRKWEFKLEKKERRGERGDRGNRLPSIPLGRREDCGAVFKGIVPSQEVYSDRAKGGGGGAPKRVREREKREEENEIKGRGICCMNERKKETACGGNASESARITEWKPIRGGEMRGAVNWRLMWMTRETQREAEKEREEGHCNVIFMCYFVCFCVCYSLHMSTTRQGMTSFKKQTIQGQWCYIFLSLFSAPCTDANINCPLCLYSLL